jgi:hypothetical protein
MRPPQLSPSLQGRHGCRGKDDMGVVVQDDMGVVLPSLLPVQVPEEEDALARDALSRLSHEGESKKNGAKVLDELKAEPSSEAHVAIASRAIDAAIADGDESDANVNAHFERLCIEQALPYNDSIRAEAIDTEVRARLVRTVKAMREKSAPTPMPESRRRHRAGMVSHE